jgi:protein-S-isoprenylcysteine O-methyltransferase Ste14
MVRESSFTLELSATMSAIDTVRPAKQDAAKSARADKSFGHRIFSCRTLVGLSAAVIGSFLVHPGHYYGHFDSAVRYFSVALVLAGLALRAWGAASAGRHTRTAAIEAADLATGGAYAHVRNPIYLGSMILGLGFVGFLGDPWMLLLYALTFAVLYVAIIPAEEKFLQQKFPEDYARYSAAVPRLVPRLRPWSGARQRPPDWFAACGELRMALLLVIISGLIWMGLWVRGL